MTTLLQVRNFNTFYGASQALRDVSFDVVGGQILCLLGRNGAGKTTTLNSIMGTVKPASGRLLLNQKNLFSLPAHEIPKRGIGYVPQGRKLFAELTVRENLEIGLQTRKQGMAGRDAALDLFPILRDRMEQQSGTLSGGEQTMLAVARAMCIEPDVILLDEPTEGLMPAAVAQIRNAVVTLKSRGVGVLLVEQRVDAVLSVADTVAFIDHGEIKGVYGIDAVRREPSLLQRFVGINEASAQQMAGQANTAAAAKARPDTHVHQPRGSGGL